MTKEELYALLEGDDIVRVMDIKTLVLDLVRERMNQDELMALFWTHLPDMDEAFVRDYFYRKNY